jgi:excinuclease UvrABC nuclease subunit
MQGNYSQSLTLANKLKQHYGDEKGLVFLAKSIIDAGKVSSARKILDAISSVENRNEILKQLFMHFVSDDNIPEALTIINDSNDRKFVFECIKEMARELARSNKNEKALNLAIQFLNTREMDEIYFITSIERARQNDIKTSLEIMMKIKNEVDRAIAMATILEFID